jgi:microcystin degradation protein MlrC
VEVRAVRDAPAAGVEGECLLAGDHPQEVGVVDRHVDDQRVAHRIAEVVRRPEGARVPTERDADVEQPSDQPVANRRLDGAGRRAVAVVLGDHQDAAGGGGGGDKGRAVADGRRQRLLHQDVLARRERLEAERVVGRRAG